MQINDTRPPYIEFQRRAVEDRTRTLETGVYSTKDVDFIIIVPHGSEGKTRIEQEYTMWLQKIKPQTGPRGGQWDGHYEVASRFAPEWVVQIETSYEKWKKGEDMDVEGIPLKNWPAISPGQLRSCLDMHLQTVEALSHASDDAIERLGMGGYNLRQRARDFLESSISGSMKLSGELAALRSENKAKEERVASLEGQLASLQAQMALLSDQQAKGNTAVNRQRGTIGA